MLFIILDTRNNVPTGYGHNSVNMIGHRYKFIQFHSFKLIRNLIPIIMYQTSMYRQPHNAVPDAPKMGYPVFGVSCDKLKPRIAIIPALYPDGHSVGMMSSSHLSPRNFPSTY